MTNVSLYERTAVHLHNALQSVSLNLSTGVPLYTLYIADGIIKQQQQVVLGIITLWLVYELSHFLRKYL